MSADQELCSAGYKDSLVRLLPSLRALAISLTGSQDGADDLVQDTVVLAMTHREQFTTGTNLRAWLFTILRNRFLSECRARARVIEDRGGVLARQLAAPPDQQNRAEIQDVRKALMILSTEERAAIILVGAEGLSYTEAARICGTCAGTVKSRVSRARQRLADILDYRSSSEIGPDGLTRAAVQRACSERHVARVRPGNSIHRRELA